ncbi:MAG TPA: hypothetical protein VHW71_04620 [Steroidobacteraceae bacterium]|jgi:hypothetical protein|nr:hypothetical protein [Steroidobacteraceae bacterium]
MNDICRTWGSPWHALHRSRATAAQPEAAMQTARPGTNTWLGRARPAGRPKAVLRPRTWLDL